MAKKPKGFKAFDQLARKLVQVPPAEVKPAKRGWWKCLNCLWMNRGTRQCVNCAAVRRRFSK